jgi:hypothetical protein
MIAAVRQRSAASRSVTHIFHMMAPAEAPLLLSF